MKMYFVFSFVFLVIDPDSKNASLVVADRMSPDRMPAVKKKDREYMGMFECKADDINVLIRHLLGIYLLLLNLYFKIIC